MEWAKDTTKFWNSVSNHICQRAAESGHLEILKWARDLNLPWQNSLHLAAANGHLEIVKYAESIMPQMFWGDLLLSAVSGKNPNFILLEYILGKGEHFWVDLTVAAAAQNGHLHVLKWAYEKNLQISSKFLHTAKFSIEILEWAISIGCEIPENFCLCAAKAHNMQILTWAIARGFAVHQNVLGYFCEKKYSEEFKLLIGLGIPCQDSNLIQLLNFQNFETFRWALDRGIPVGESTVNHISLGGYLEPFMILLERNFPVMDDSFYSFVYTSDSDKILEIAKSRGLDFMQDSFAYLAIKHGRMNTLNWFHKNGFKFDDPEFCNFAASHFQKNVLIWLRGVGCPWNVSTCLTAACNSNWEILEWLILEGCPCGEKVFNEVVTSKNCLEIVKFLRKNGIPWSHKTWKLATKFQAIHKENELLIYLQEEGCPGSQNWKMVKQTDGTIKWIVLLSE